MIGCYQFSVRRIIMKRNKKIIIMLLVLIFSISVTLIDAFVHPNYFVKIPIKIVFFLALPMLFFIKNKE